MMRQDKSTNRVAASNSTTTLVMKLIMQFSFINGKEARMTGAFWEFIFREFRSINTNLIRFRFTGIPLPTKQINIVRPFFLKIKLTVYFVPKPNYYMNTKNGKTLCKGKEGQEGRKEK